MSDGEFERLVKGVLVAISAGLIAQFLIAPRSDAQWWGPFEILGFIMAGILLARAAIVHLLRYLKETDTWDTEDGW